MMSLSCRSWTIPTRLAPPQARRRQPLGRSRRTPRVRRPSRRQFGLGLRRGLPRCCRRRHCPRHCLLRRHCRRAPPPPLHSPPPLPPPSSTPHQSRRLPHHPPSPRARHYSAPKAGGTPSPEQALLSALYPPTNRQIRAPRTVCWAAVSAPARASRPRRTSGR